jgi:hypothetical protein
VLDKVVLAARGQVVGGLRWEAGESGLHFSGSKEQEGYTITAELQEKMNLAAKCCQTFLESKGH